LGDIYNREYTLQMKQEILEHLIRLCVREVIDQVKEEEKTTDEPKDDGETKGAPAPPEDGQGTGDQPEIPDADPDAMGNDDTDAEEPKGEDPDGDTVQQTSLKGPILVNPRDKSKLQKVPLKATTDDASLERNLHRLAAAVAGSHVKVAISAQRMVKDVLRNPSATAYLYLGKYDPSSDEIFLMADKSLQVAKDASIPPAELTGAPTAQVAPTDFHALTASPDALAQRMDYGAQTPAHINEGFKKVVKKMVSEILDTK
jgi:hypothetical protein